MSSRINIGVLKKNLKKFQDSERQKNLLKNPRKIIKLKKIFSYILNMKKILKKFYRSEKRWEIFLRSEKVIRIKLF